MLSRRAPKGTATSSAGLAAASERPSSESGNGERSNRTSFGVAFASMFHKVQGMVFGEPTVRPLAHNPALLPVFLHLGLVLMLGLWIPPYLAEWYRQAARLIG